MKRKKGVAGTITTILVMLALAAFIIFMFINASKKDENKTESNSTETEVEKLINRDLEQDYPVTARETLKFYSRISLQLHGKSKLTDQQIEALSDQLRLLYADELLKQNSREEHLQQINDEIKEYEETSQQVVAYQIEKAGSAIKWTQDDKEFQRLIVVYALSDKDGSGAIYEEFILCNEDNRWKILGWREVDGAEMDVN